MSFLEIAKVMAQEESAKGSAVPSGEIGLTGIGSITALATTVTNVLIVVGIAVLVVMLAMGFLKYITSQGDKTGVESAQKTLTYAAIGGVGLLLVYALRTILLGLLGAGDDFTKY